MADPLLNTELKRRVQDVYAEFVSDVNPTRLSDWLIQEKVITIDQWQEIKASEKTNPDICRRLLNHLFHLSNPKTFLVVREALVKQNHWLLQKIDQHHCTCKQTEMFAELEKSNKALQSQVMELKDELGKYAELEKSNQQLQSQVMELKDKLVKYAELEKSNQQLLSQVMEHKDKLVKYAELEKSNKLLLSQVMEHKDELEKYAELEQNNKTLKSQMMELKDELDKAITAKNDLEEERRIWIVRERDLTNTMNSTKAEFVRLNIDWVVKEHKYIKEIAHLRDNVATNKNELLLTRRVS